MKYTNHVKNNDEKLKPYMKNTMNDHVFQLTLNCHFYQKITFKFMNAMQKLTNKYFNPFLAVFFWD